MVLSTLTLKQLVEYAEAHLIQHNYANSTIQRYRSTWNALVLYYTEFNLTAYHYGTCLEIITKRCGIKDIKKISSYQRFQIRCLEVLDAIANNIPVPRCSRNNTVMTHPDFTGVWQEFLAQLDLNPKTIRGKGIILTRFLNFLSDNGYNDIAQLEQAIILKYVALLESGGYAPSTRAGILFCLRQFFQFLYQQGYTEMPLQDLYPTIMANKHERLPSVYTEKEVAIILRTIDRKSPLGKRDYLILLMATQLGIRAGDIRTMTFDSFNWDRNTIEFVQQKTTNPIQLPLTVEIRYALIDYWRNSRPVTDSPFVFIRTRAPYEAYSSANVFHYVISKYLNISKIEYNARHHGLHSMRHSLASNLLRNNTPYPVITGILGHKNPNTTRAYLSIDIEQLRSVALEVPREK